MIFVDEDKCTGCGDCLPVCPEEGAIVLQQDKAVINQDICTNCADCVTACPESAIYEVEATPMVTEQAQPAQVTRQSTLSRARPAIVSTLAAAAPLAVDALTGLARRWLEGRSAARKTGGRAQPAPGGQAEPGPGGRRRRQRGRGRR
jgi:NAD-dependent dihydropyrimidine dehydrogenase PreA subunit